MLLLQATLLSGHILAPEWWDGEKAWGDSPGLPEEKDASYIGIKIKINPSCKYSQYLTGL